MKYKGDIQDIVKSCRCNLKILQDDLSILFIISSELFKFAVRMFSAQLGVKKKYAYTGLTPPPYTGRHSDR